jgi:DNA invertase Pin-like site-specific DNA recombinase
MERLAETKAGFRSLTEAIDTTTPAGRMMMQMVGSFVEFERSMLRSALKLVWKLLDGKGELAGHPKADWSTGSRDRADHFEAEKGGC